MFLVNWEFVTPWQISHIQKMIRDDRLNILTAYKLSKHWDTVCPKAIRLACYRIKLVYIYRKVASVCVLARM